MKVQSIYPALAVLALAGCKGGDSTGYVPVPPPKVEKASLKPGDEMSLFPVAVGNQWTYEVNTVVRNAKQQQTSNGEITFKVVNVEETADGKKAQMEIWAKGKLTDRQVWTIGPKGIFKVSAGLKTVTTFSPPAPIVLFPLDKYKTFTWEGLGGKVKRKASSRVLPVQEIDTDEKRFSAYPIETKGQNSDGKLVQTTLETNWLVPGVGLVRNHLIAVSPSVASEMRINLKSHTLK